MVLGVKLPMGKCTREPGGGPAGPARNWLRSASLAPLFAASTAVRKFYVDAVS